MAYSPDFQRFMYQQPRWGYQAQPAQNGQNNGSMNLTGTGMETITDKVGGLFGTETGVSGQMGMGSDAASLASAESSMGSGASSGSSSGALGTMGWVAAAIAAQHMLSDDTSTEIDGVKTNDAFSGHFGTEPWLAWAHDKAGIEPTAGEKFDAAVENSDWSKAGENFNGMTSYWANPTSSWLASGGEALGLDHDTAQWLSPESKVGQWSDKLFGKWF